MSTLQLFPNNSVSPTADLPRLFKLKNGRYFVRSNAVKFSTSFNQDKQAPASVNLNGKSGFVGSKEVMDRAASVLVETYARAPVVLSSGKGCKVYDVEGREYIDITVGIDGNALDHGDPELLKALDEQANVLTHVSNVYHSIPQVELAKRLAECSFANRVFFSNSGTGANDAAMQFARKFQRFSQPDDKHPASEFIAFSNSFHERTMGA